jgi:hypothetical protein
MAEHKYLLDALKHFLADAHDRDRAQKRGGTREILSLDALAAEETYGWEPADEWTAERVLERRAHVDGVRPGSPRDS